ncbi:MRNIP protein, partial [Rhinopomastus cyanomelas]|nr:MRNIP protein [Rhinopomastus cyanomelas]
ASSPVLTKFLQIYGEGSGQECRCHVQKLNLLQGEAEEIAGWTSWCREDSLNDRQNIAAQHEESLVQQGGRAEVSRWSKYLDNDHEDEEDQEEEGTERQQFCSQRKSTVKEQSRKCQKSFLCSDVQEHPEEIGVFQLASRAKKHKKHSVVAPDRGDGGAVCGDTVVPAVCESAVPEESTQAPTARTHPSKWDRFLSCSDNSVSMLTTENAAGVTLSPQEGSGRLGLHSTAAAGAGTTSTRSEQAGNVLLPGTGFPLKKCGGSTAQHSLELPGVVVPSASYSGEDVLFKESQTKLLRAGPGVPDTTAGRCCLESTRRADTPMSCKTVPKPNRVSYEPLFCTGEEFDDDL